MGEWEEVLWSVVRQKDACGTIGEATQNSGKAGVGVWGRDVVNNETPRKETGCE